MLKRIVMPMVSLALLAWSCTPRGAQTRQAAAGRGAEDPAVSAVQASYLNPWDTETQEALESGIGAFSQPPQRFVEVDMSSRIDRRSARRLYESFRSRYRPGVSCHFMSRDELSATASGSPDGLWVLSGSETSTGPAGPLQETIPVAALQPLLSDTRIWLEALEQARPDLSISINRLCVFLLTKNDAFDGRGLWHADSAGQISALWTLYGQPTWYTEGVREPETQSDIRIPSFGRLLMLKSQGHPDLKAHKAIPVLHTTPPKPGDRLTFVVFFSAAPRRQAETK